MSTLFLLLVVIIVLLSLIRIQQISDDILKASGLRNVFVARFEVSLRMADVKQIMSILTISGSVAEKVVEDWVASQFRRCKRCEEDSLNAFTTDALNAFVKDAFTTDAFVKDALTTDAFVKDALTTDALTTDVTNAFINDEKEDILAKTL